MLLEYDVNVKKRILTFCFDLKKILLLEMHLIRELYPILTYYVHFLQRLQRLLLEMHLIREL